MTVLRATGGFGKTVLLAECCRALSDAGVATAWLSLDELDTPAALDRYIAAACVQTGLPINSVLKADEFAGHEGRVGVVVRAIQLLPRPFVLAFDELERLTDSSSVSLLAFLVERGPPNLHLAFAGRHIPAGLNIAGGLFDGHAEILEADDLRFSRRDISRFFNLGLSRSALADEAKRSAGWPVALRIARNAGQRGTKDGTDPHHLVANWVESRLFDGLAPDDREFVLDLGQFDWFDAPLLDEVLQAGGSMGRLKSMTLLEGLFETTGVGSSHWRLHAMLRKHCAEVLSLESPDRFRAVHQGIAAALARRRDIVRAMRHANQGGEPNLAGEIYEQAGGVRVWTRDGAAQFLAADRLLAEQVLAGMPRLRLARAAALALTGAHGEARALYADCVKPGNRVGGSIEFDVDDCLVRSAMALYGCEPLDTDRIPNFFRDSDRLARSPRLDATTRGDFEYAQCVLHFLKGEFDPALTKLSVARSLLSGTHYLEFHGELLRGQIAFVRGRPDDARMAFQRARRIARKHFLSDPVASMACAIAGRELALERAPATVSEPPGLLGVLSSNGVPFSFFTTAASLCIELRLRDGAFDEALTMADDLLAHLRSAEATGFLRFTAALRVSVLLRSGRTGDAGHAWRAAAFPRDSARCVDLSGQSWREMEVVSEARVRLLIANGRYADARSLVRELSAVATTRGFVRTRMRALSLSILLEQQAGRTETSLASLQEYLRLFSETPYAWPLVRERRSCAAALNRFLQRYSDSTHRQNASSLLEAMHRIDDGSILLLSARERQILRLLPGRRIKQVATELGLSVHGVRYHLRKLFAKLGAANRDELIQKAKEADAVLHDP